MYLALGIATVIYIAVSLGVFGTLTVDKVISSGGTAIAIASIGSAVALVIFTMITAAHLRIRADSGANLLVLIVAIAAADAVLVTFVFTTLIHEPASIITLAGIVVLSIGLDYGWKHFHAGGTKNVQLAH